jgi:hypothetical protein
MNDFITWWFDTHYIWSTLLTPAMTLAWCCWKGVVVRGSIAFICMGGITFGASRRS